MSGRNPKRLEQLMLAELPQIKAVHPGYQPVVHYVTERMTSHGPEAQVEVEYRKKGTIHFERVFL